MPDIVTCKKLFDIIPIELANHSSFQHKFRTDNERSRYVYNILGFEKWEKKVAIKALKSLGYEMVFPFKDSNKDPDKSFRICRVKKGCNVYEFYYGGA